MSKTVIRQNKEKVYTTLQWGVMNTTTKKVVRTALTRRVARLFARTSKNYVVVKRKIKVGAWRQDDVAKEYEQFWRK